MLVTIGLLVALHIILSRFLSVNAWNMKIGFAFRQILSKTIVPGQNKGVIGLEQSLAVLPEDVFMLTPDMVFHL